MYKKIILINLLIVFLFLPFVNAFAQERDDNYVYIYLTARDRSGYAFSGTFKVTAVLKKYNQNTGEWIKKRVTGTIRTNSNGEGWTSMPGFSFNNWVTAGEIRVYYRSINNNNFLGSTFSNNSKKATISVRVYNP
ncbi:MAG: hypothetical protein KAU06_04365 [Candidatus Marinimicrobia bacterium]|nr:hypothetical protein [Candidatus Neomarinimicrobiota bacterium]